MGHLAPGAPQDQFGQVQHLRGLSIETKPAGQTDQPGLDRQDPDQQRDDAAGL